MGIKELSLELAAVSLIADEAKLDKLIERITKARIEQKHIYITGRPKVRPTEEEVNGLINKYCEIHGTTYKDFFRQTGYRVGKEKISSARCDVCREIKVKYPHLVFVSSISSIDTMLRLRSASRAMLPRSMLTNGCCL